MFCWQVNRNPVRLHWRVRVLNVCSGHVLSFARTWSGEALHALPDRASVTSSSSACCVVMLFFSFLVLESKGHVFDLPRLVQICRSDFFRLFGMTFVYVCIFLLFNYQTRITSCGGRWRANGLKIWFEWVALVIFFCYEGSGIIRLFDKLHDRDSASRTRPPVFKSNQFSFVPNRKGNIFRQDVFRSPDSSSVGCSSCIEYSGTEWGGDLFWIYALDFRRVFACYCSLLAWGLYRILFKLLMNAGRGFEVLVPFGRKERRSQPTRATVRLWTSAITFLLLLDQERVSNDAPEEVGYKKT